MQRRRFLSPLLFGLILLGAPAVQAASVNGMADPIGGPDLTSTSVEFGDEQRRNRPVLSDINKDAPSFARPVAIDGLGGGLLNLVPRNGGQERKAYGSGLSLR